MGKMKELFIEQQLSGSIGGDEDYLYEQYLKEKEYWDSIHSGSIFRRTLNTMMNTINQPIHQHPMRKKKTLNN